MVIGFLEAYRDINVRLILADHIVNLVDDHVDVAVRVANLPDSGLVVSHLGSLRWVTCARPAYLAKRGVPQSLEDLRIHDCISSEGSYSSDTWTFAIRKRMTSITVRPRFAVNTADAAIDAAVASSGITHVLS